MPRIEYDQVSIMLLDHLDPVKALVDQHPYPDLDKALGPAGRKSLSSARLSLMASVLNWLPMNWLPMALMRKVSQISQMY